MAPPYHQGRERSPSLCSADDRGARVRRRHVLAGIEAHAATRRHLRRRGLDRVDLGRPGRRQTRAQEVGCSSHSRVGDALPPATRCVGRRHRRRGGRRRSRSVCPGESARGELRLRARPDLRRARPPGVLPGRHRRRWRACCRRRSGLFGTPIKTDWYADRASSERLAEG